MPWLLSCVGTCFGEYGGAHVLPDNPANLDIEFYGSTGHAVFSKSTHLIGTDVLSEETKSTENAITVWCQVDGCSGLVGELALFE